MLFSSTLNSLTDPASVTAYMTLETMANFTTSIEGDQTVSIESGYRKILL